MSYYYDCQLLISPGAGLPLTAHDKPVQSANGTKKRGLASASEETKERVAMAGGNALHEKRGLQAAPPDVRIAIARKGGLARGKQRHQDKEKLQSSRTE